MEGEDQAVINDEPRDLGSNHLGTRKELFAHLFKLFKK